MESVFETFQVGKGDERIFSKDIEGLDLSFQDSIEYLEIGKPRLCRDFFFPGLFKTPSRCFIINPDMAGEEFGKAAHIKGALGIILGEHRVDPSAFLFRLSGQQGEIAQGLDGLGSVKMLRHT